MKLMAWIGFFAAGGVAGYLTRGWVEGKDTAVLLTQIQDLQAQVCELEELEKRARTALEKAQIQAVAARKKELINAKTSQVKDKVQQAQDKQAQENASVTLGPNMHGPRDLRYWEAYHRGP